MLVLGLVVILLCVLLWNLVMHPLRSALTMVRLLCAVLGVWQLLNAVGKFWGHDYLLAGGYLVAAVFLSWCSTKLAPSQTTTA